MEDWNELASRIFKAKIKKKGITYEEVCPCSSAIGCDQGFYQTKR
jgi:hypothetical protein